ncbi:TlpA family protein disulfide reductase [candidate division WOR-3 bacterium]|nr:TlpA family protein disulfide reductase [candidate division WOR-3 bacterium]
MNPESQRRKIKQNLKVLFFIILIIILAGCSKEEKKGPKEETSKKVKLEKWGNAPDFTLPELGGEQFTFSSLKGKVIILDFWATWCGPCRVEIPDFISLYKKYKDKGLEIIGISLDRDKESAVAPFARQMGINYIIVFGGKEVTEKYGGIRGIPTTFIIDQKGNIFKKYVGVRTKNIFEADIKELLGE